MPDSEILAEVTARGDRRAALEALRERVAAELGAAGGRDVAALSKELRDVMRELDALPSAGVVTKLDRIADELAAKRAAHAAGRGADSASS